MGELFRVNDAGQFSAADFIAFCREHAVDSGMVAQQWAAFGGSDSPQDQLQAPEGRTAIAIMLEDALGHAKPDESKLDAIFDWAMQNTDFTVSKSQFMEITTKV